MSMDTELETWRREWRSEATAVPDLASKVRHQSMYMRLLLSTEVLITVAIGGCAIAWAIRSSQADVVVLAIAVWIFCGAAWAFGLRNRRNCWTPAAMTTSAFLDVSIRRSQSAITASTFGLLLYSCEMVFCLGWIYHRKSHEMHTELSAFLTSQLLLAVSIGTVAFLAAIAWYRRRKRNELAYLLQLKRADWGDGIAAVEVRGISKAPWATRTLSYLRFRRRRRLGKV